MSKCCPERKIYSSCFLPKYANIGDPLETAAILPYIFSYSLDRISSFHHIDIWTESNKYWMFISIFLAVPRWYRHVQGAGSLFVWSAYSWVLLCSQFSPTAINQYFSHILSLSDLWWCRADTQNFSILFHTYSLFSFSIREKSVPSNKTLNISSREFLQFSYREESFFSVLRDLHISATIWWW